MSASGQETNVDIAIVGGGPAGLSAAVWCARYLHSVALVDSGDARNCGHAQDQRLPRHSIRSRRPICERADETTCRQLGVELIDGIVLRAEKHDDDHFLLCLEGGDRVHSRRLLLAIGLRDVWPDVPGVETIYGANAHVCPDCDGYDSRGKKVVVIGNGRRAVGMALNLATWTRDIIICTNGRPPDLDEPEYSEKLDALNIPVITERVARCATTSRASSACASRAAWSSTPTRCSSPSHSIRRTTWARSSGVSATTKGTSPSMRMDTRRCGTCSRRATSRREPQLAIVAAADGATAALAMHKSLVPAARKLTPREPRRLLHGDRSRLLVANDLQRRSDDSSPRSAASVPHVFNSRHRLASHADDHVARPEPDPKCRTYPPALR